MRFALLAALFLSGSALAGPDSTSTLPVTKVGTPSTNAVTIQTSPASPLQCQGVAGTTSDIVLHDFGTPGNHLGVNGAGQIGISNSSFDIIDRVGRALGFLSPGTSYIGRVRQTDGTLDLTLLNSAPGSDTGQIAVPVRIISQLGAGGGGGSTDITIHDNGTPSQHLGINASGQAAIQNEPNLDVALSTIKSHTDNIPSSPSTDRTTAAAPFSVQLALSGAFIDPRAIRALTATDVVTTVPPSNASTNVAQFGGFSIVTGTGASGLGIPRVTVANDSIISAAQFATWTMTQGNGNGNPAQAWTVTGPLTDTQLRATAVPVSGPLTDTQLRAGSVPVSGPLTDTQLRASAVPVSGPLTDTQLRASAVPTDPTDRVGRLLGHVTVDSVPSTPVTGPLTDTQLRASAVPTDPADRAARLLGHVTVDSVPTTAVTVGSALTVNVVSAPPALNPLLPRCNAVRRSNCQP